MTFALRTARLLILPVLTTAALACNSLLDTTQNLATSAQIIVTGDSPVPLELILSNEYTATTDQSGNVSVQLLAADTLMENVPINETYDLGGGARIFVRLTNPDTVQAANVHMRILLDGTEEVYNVQASLVASSLEYRFAYY